MMTILIVVIILYSRLERRQRQATFTSARCSNNSRASRRLKNALRFIGAARVVWSMKRYGVRPSVRPYVYPISMDPQQQTRCCRFAAVCPDDRTCGERMRALPLCQRTQVAEHRLVLFRSTSLDYTVCVIGRSSASADFTQISCPAYNTNRVYQKSP